MSASTRASESRVVLDRSALRRKYAEERAKRLRPDGMKQYRQPSEQMQQDPWNPVVEREPVSDDVTFTFIGGGWAGILAGTYLAKNGIHDVRVVDSAGDFGGVWYWNRYPGVMCDSPSLAYMPLLEDTGHIPTEKYAHGPEILEHCQRVARQFGLYEKALFHTKVLEIRWDDDRSCWIVSTDRGDEFTTKFIGIGLGPLCVPHLPGVEGIEEFGGHSFHTSRWDYAYTGGDPKGAGMENLQDKRVAIIGTGATAVQCIPALAADSMELYVFQRTPSAVDVRDNGAIDPDWFRVIATPGWQDRYMRNFATNWEGVYGRPGPDIEVENLFPGDGFVEIGRRLRAAMHSVPPTEITPERIAAAVEDSDDREMEAIRARVDAVVTSPETAERLKAWYGRLCKRPCYHDEYLPAFNRPNTHLIDTDGKGIERITKSGVVANGVEYEVDCIIYASGFDFAVDILYGLKFDVIGRDGQSLAKEWADGPKTLHGMHVAGFPNLFVVQLAQGSFFGSSVPVNWTDTAKTIAAVTKESLNRSWKVVLPAEQAQTEWVGMVVRDGQVFGVESCTPGYYNNEGAGPGPNGQLFTGDPRGPLAFFNYIDEWRQSGSFDGLHFE